ncbi:MAG: serine/threonine-protein kinase [Nanoarchaeota archaeon]
MTDSIDEICIANGFENPVRIGAGGQGVVYKVFFPFEQRDFAIKISGLGYTTEGARAFRREASLQRRVSRDHPRIPYVYDFNSPESNPSLRYIIMDYAGDGTLLNNVLPVDTVVDVALSLVEALDACHKKLVVHGDVKPSNVCLDGSRVSLIDFGAARQYKDLEAEYRGSDSERTFFQGTIGYAAPERVFSFVAPEAFESSDIFSTGITLYELLSGKKPFHELEEGRRNPEDTIFTYLRRIREKDYVPLQASVPAISERLATLVHSMIEHDPHHRPASFRTIADEFAKYRASKSEYLPK